MVLRAHPPSGAPVAILGYVALLAAGYWYLQSTGLSPAAAGIRHISPASLLVGLAAGLLVIAPVWHWPLLSIGGGAWLAAVVTVEEIVFRGVLFAALQRAGGAPLAVGGSTFIFTLAHAASYPGPALALVALAGLYLGLLRALTGDLWASGIAHALMNVASLG